MQRLTRLKNDYIQIGGILFIIVMIMLWYYSNINNYDRKEELIRQEILIHYPWIKTDAKMRERIMTEHNIEGLKKIDRELSGVPSRY